MAKLPGSGMVSVLSEYVNAGPGMMSLQNISHSSDTYMAWQPLLDEHVRYEPVDQPSAGKSAHKQDTENGTTFEVISVTICISAYPNLSITAIET